MNITVSSQITRSYLDGWTPAEIRESQLKDLDIALLMDAKDNIIQSNLSGLR